jgi:hypothetical protein
MKSPNTDKTICIPGRNWGPEEKFREVRHRAKDVEQDRHKKTRRDKTLKKDEIRYKVDDKVVLVSNHWEGRCYFLVQVIDYNPIEKVFFGILIATTDVNYFEQMIGHLITFGRWYGFNELNVPPSSIKWLPLTK